MANKNKKEKSNKMDGKSKDVWGNKLDKLQQEFPEVLSENKIDCDQLKKFVGDKNVAEGDRYQFSWAGKSKVFQEIKRRTTKTLKPDREESVNFNDTDNIFIEGENLEVLKILQKSYYGKVKMIYIDPPYNTGSDFVYNDDFKRSRKEEEKESGNLDEEGNLKKGLVKNTKTGRYHSNWLNMMYPRLYLARNLLKEDGVIFVSIDDNEVHNLRMIMNEIFGEENFVTALQWKGRGGRQDSAFVAEVHEYILVYAKNKNNFIVGEQEKKDESFPKYDENKKKHYKTQLVRKWGSNSRREDRPNLYYSIEAPDGSKIYPKLPDGSDGCWRWSEKRLKKEIKSKNVEFVKKNNKWVLYEKIYEPEEGEKRTKKFNSWLQDIPSTATGTKEIKTLFDDIKVFDYPKPTNLMIRLIDIANVSKGEIVLDFFAGSSSLAHAVMEQNTDDGGNRKYIMAQLPEEIDEDSEARKAGYDNIADIAKERIRRASKKINKSDKNELDLGFKSFKLSDSNFKQWIREEIEDEENLQQKLEDAIENLDKNTEKENILFELMLKLGIDPNVEIKNKQNYFAVKEGEYVICLEDKITKDIIDKILEEGPHVVVCLDSAFDGNDELKTNTALQMKSKDIEFKIV